MSRTHHHKDQKGRHSGRDLWSRRIFGGLCYDTYNKWLTRRRERAGSTALKSKLLKDPEGNDKV